MQQFQNIVFPLLSLRGGRQKRLLWLPFAALSAILCAMCCSGTDWPVWPTAPQTTVVDEGALCVDASNTADGYFAASSLMPSENRLKMRVEKDGMTLTYDLDGSGEQQIFPLQLGDGEYQVTLYENVGGKKYAQAGHVSLSVQLADPLAPYLYTNQYVSYTPEDPVMAEAGQLAASQSGEALYTSIHDYLIGGYLYDYIKALTVGTGELPDIAACYETKAGICQDLSALTVCLLRSGGIPAKLVIGYADDSYHAWVLAYPDGKETFFDPTAELDAIASPKDYDVERWY